MYEHVADDNKLKGRMIIALQKAIVTLFSAAEWKEVGYKTGHGDYIKGHSRLLRSLSWQDEDYGSCVFQAIEKILDEDIENLSSFFEFQEVKSWFLSNEPSLSRDIGIGENKLAPKFTAPILSAWEVVERALRDAESLMETTDATSAIDRVHTALHGYLRYQCNNAGIDVSEHTKITDLYKSLRKHHPKLNTSEAWSDDVDRVLKSFASVIDTLNHLRNNASVAHPNEALISAAEAELVCNASRTILHYLDMKLR